MHSSAEIDAELAEERRRARPAMIAAIAAGILIPAGLVWQVLLSGHAPSPINGPAFLRFYDHHSVSRLLASLVNATGLLLLVPVALYLWRVISFRRPDTSRLLRIAGVGGGILTALGTAVTAFYLAIASGQFVERDYQTLKAGKDLLSAAPMTLASVLQGVGTLLIATWFVMVSLNAMRLGLFTRQLSLVGIVLGPLYVFSVMVGIIPVLVMLGLWLIALGVLFAGHWPGGRPRAWQSGTAIPWPTAAERQAQLKKLKNASKTET